jgi:hypothetical protein
MSVRTMKLNENILLVVDNSTVYALDMDSGEQLWTFRALNLRDIDVDHLIYLMTQASLICLDTQGRLEWEIPLANTSVSSIRGSQKHLVFITDSPHTLTCYSEQGKIQWDHTTENRAPITHVFIEKDGVYICAKGIYLLNIDSGRTSWAVKKSNPIAHAVLTEHHVIIRDNTKITCIDRKGGSISWERPLSDYGVPLNKYAVQGDRVYLPDNSVLVDTIIRESDGTMIFDVESHPLMSVAGTDKEILLCTPREGVLCIDGSGNKVWNHYTHADTYRIVIDGQETFMTGTNGKVIGFVLDQSDPFFDSLETPHFSHTLGDITSIRIRYSFDFCLELVFGESYLVLQDDHYYVQESYEDGTVYVTGERCFDGKEIPKEMVESVYDSITNVYVDSSHILSYYPAHVRITVEIELETGEIITLVSGENISQFTPWIIMFRGHQATQYSGEISMALCTLMDEIGWGFKEWETFQQWGYVTGGFCGDPLSLADFR